MQKRIKNINKFTKQPIKYQKNILNFLIKKGVKNDTIYTTKSSKKGDNI